VRGRGFEPLNQDINKLVLLGLKTKNGGIMRSFPDVRMVKSEIGHFNRVKRGHGAQKNKKKKKKKFIYASPLLRHW